ncbi:cohesin domain-containing protein [Eubacterium callanderi]|jgi:hypothetical protein|uniref:cohesin domain-containing protein n=1 Tax=Eubacterium callanderi TaxID=53442 RepID=UPI001D149BA3|nr:cohesin domain-containing protein [Eubacterium callanderi]MCC3402625.1 hypothetical protein [Eubacterium callanderi]
MKNKVLKKITSMLTVLTLVFALVAPSVLAARTSTVTLSSDKDNQKVKAGDIITVTCKVDEDLEFRSCQFHFTFDKDKLEFLADESICNIPNALSSMKMSQEGLIKLAAASAKNQTTAGNPICTLKFKVKADIAGSPNFDFTVPELKYSDEQNVGQSVEITPVNTTDTVKIVIVTDKTALETALENANKMYTDGIFTSDSKAALKAVIDTAQAVYDNDGATQAQVDEATVNLNDAVKTPPMVEAVDTTALVQAIEKAAQFTEDKLKTYTPASVAVFSEALNNAQSVLETAANLEKTEVNEQTVANAAKALEDAITGLESIPDKANLESAISEAKAMLEDSSVSYMKAQEEALDKAMKDAQVVLNNESATEAEVKAIAESLDKAITDAKMNVAGDQNVLNDAIAQYMKDYPEDNYITSSYNELKTAIEEARALSQKMDNEQVLKTEVDKVIQKMGDGAAKLILRATEDDKAQLNQAIAKGDGLLSDKESYITSAFEKMEKALEDAKVVAQNKDVTKDQVDEAYNQLNAALTNLESQKRATDAEKSELIKIVKEKLNADYYTKDSYSVYEEAYNAAKSIVDNKDVTKAQVDEAFTKLDTAQKALVTYAIDKKTNIEVTGLPAGTGITVKDQSKDSALTTKVEEAIKANQAFEGFNTTILTLLTIKPDMTDDKLAAFNADSKSSVTVYIPLSEDQLGYSSYRVCHIKDDGSIEWLTPEIVNDGKTLKLAVSSFSEFAVVGVKSPESPAGGDTKKPTSSDSKNAGAGTINPSTGLPYTEGELQTGAMQAMAMLALMGLAGIVLVRRRKTSVK